MSSPQIHEDGDEDELVATPCRKAPANMLQQIDGNVIITTPAARKTTREAVNGRSFAIYDQRYHPMDDYLRRGRAKGSTRVATRKRTRSSTPEDPDSENDPENEDEGSSAPTRKSSRIASQTIRPLYSIKIHPQDEDLKELAALDRRRGSATHRRKNVLVIESSDPEDDSEANAEDDAEDDAENNTDDAKKSMEHPPVDYVPLKDQTVCLSSPSLTSYDTEDPSSQLQSPDRRTSRRSTPGARSLATTPCENLQPPDSDEGLSVQHRSPQVYQRSAQVTSPGTAATEGLQLPAQERSFLSAQALVNQTGVSPVPTPNTHAMDHGQADLHGAGLPGVISGVLDLTPVGQGQSSLHGSSPPRVLSERLNEELPPEHPMPSSSHDRDESPEDEPPESNEEQSAAEAGMRFVCLVLETWLTVLDHRPISTLG
jgi:hypothetical protein